MERSGSLTARWACFVITLVGCGEPGTAVPESPRPTTISVSPESGNLTFLGETATFVASVRDQYGAMVPATIVWTSDAPTVFSVNTGGVVTAVSNGSGTVGAQFQELRASAQVVVMQATRSLDIVAGDDQVGKPGVELSAPVVVRSLDAGGAPVAGSPIVFTPAEGSGSADPDSVRTDGDGEAATRWTLGSDVGPQSLTIAVADGPQADVVATATVGPCDRSPVVVAHLVGATAAISCEEITDEMLARATHLNLGGYGISTLNAYDFLGLSGLRSLVLADNNLTELPRGLFSGLVSLSRLHLFENRLTELPADIFAGLSSLAVLSLDKNELTELPAGVFSGLDNLQDLYLGDNRLSRLPPGIFAGLGNLAKLELQNNGLAALPTEAFSELGKLNVLELYDNRLAELSASTFARLKEVYTLRLHNNQLAELPPGIFAGLDGLVWITLNENRLVEMPADIFSGLALGILVPA